jgi:hypothetical protein
MKPSPRIEINVILLGSTGFTNPQVLLSDYLAPFETLVSMRQARASIAIAQAKREVPVDLQNASTSSNGNATEAPLVGYGYPLPLGWRLSPITRLLILGQNGDRHLCRSATMQNNDCVQQRIYEQLK